MAAGDHDRSGELRISLEQRLILQDEDDADDYRDSYVRRMRGPILLASGEPETEVKIGEVELIYFDGSRAVDAQVDQVLRVSVRVRHAALLRVTPVEMLFRKMDESRANPPLPAKPWEKQR